MKILAFDSSGKTYSAALFTDNRLEREWFSDKLNFADAARADFSQVEPKKEILKLRPDATSALFRLIEQLLHDQGWKMTDLEGLAIAQGPGLFTGLRVGVVAAKLLAYSLNIPLVAVNTLDAIAWQTIKNLNASPVVAENLSVDSNSEILVLINAQRQQWFVRRYPAAVFRHPLEQGTEQDFRSPESLLLTNPSTEILTTDQIAQRLTDHSLISGSGLKDLPDSFSDHFNKLVPRESWHCSAATIGHWAWFKFQTGEFSDIWNLEPLYYRPSYAEEK
jgi:tRNA threonylcarbamoyladenosine biosynthesis protein TsaB